MPLPRKYAEPIFISTMYPSAVSETAVCMNHHGVCERTNSGLPLRGMTTCRSSAL